MCILIKWIGVGLETAFLTSSQEMLILLVRGPHVEKQKVRRQRASKGVFLLLAGALDPNSGAFL